MKKTASFYQILMLCLIVILGVGIFISKSLFFTPSNSSPPCGPYPDWKTSEYVLPYPVGKSYSVWQGNCFGGHLVNVGGAFRHSYDFDMPIGSQITAARAGKVAFVRNKFKDGNGGGPIATDNVVLIDHGDGSYALYSHLTFDGILVEQGDIVEQGQPIALSGNTGMTGGVPHLHFTVSKCPKGLIPCDNNVTSIPVTFRNTRPNPDGLQTHETYEAFAQVPILAKDVSIEGLDGTERAQRLADFEIEIEKIHTDLHLVGLGIGIVRNSQLSWFKGIGFADLENKVPVTQNTPFHLASLTKPFASTVLMQIVEEGKLNLDTQASEFGIYFDNSESITVKHILSHTSDGNPGEAYRYSGSRFHRLDLVIAQTTGSSFEANLKDRIVGPLKLKHTGRMTEIFEPRLANTYQLNEDGVLESCEVPRFLGVSAGLVASISDYALFIAAIEKNLLLKPETQEISFTQMKSTSGRDLPYGLGWFIEMINGRKVIWHYGSWTCISTLVVMVPEENIAFLAFANTNGLSSDFNLGSGELQQSPVGSAFLRIFVPNAP